MYTFVFLFATIAKHGKLSYQKHRGRTMKSIIKFGATLAGLTLSGVASAGVPSGTITFIASDVGPALSVPTLGVVTAVMLAGVLLVLALHTLHKNRHTLASFVLVGSSIGAALMVAQTGVLSANGADFNEDVLQSDLTQPILFPCDDPELITVFSNASGVAIEVESIERGDCTLNTSQNNCLAPSGQVQGTVLLPGESCEIAALWD